MAESRRNYVDTKDIARFRKYMASVGCGGRSDLQSEIRRGFTQ